MKDDNTNLVGKHYVDCHDSGDLLMEVMGMDTLDWLVVKPVGLDVAWSRSPAWVRKNVEKYEHPDRDYLIQNAARVVDHINHEEYKLPGYGGVWVCGWSSPRRRWDMAGSTFSEGGWFTYYREAGK